MEYTKQNYKNALEIFSEYLNNRYDVDFSGYCETRIKELEQPKISMYKCIKVPNYNLGTFELGKTYSPDWNCCGFKMFDLPNHFELIVPKPESEKITWDEVRTVISNALGSVYWPPVLDSLPLVMVSNRIKKDYL